MNTIVMATALDYVHGQAMRTWKHSHSRGPLAWLLRRVGALTPIQGVWIEQYLDGDWETAHCQGQVIQTWKYAADGLLVVHQLPELDRANNIASATPVFSFCVDAAERRMMYQEWHGPLAGHGRILARSASGEWITEKCCWKS